MPHLTLSAGTSASQLTCNRIQSPSAILFLSSPSWKFHWMSYQGALILFNSDQYVTASPWISGSLQYWDLFSVHYRVKVSLINEHQLPWVFWENPDIRG